MLRFLLRSIGKLAFQVPTLSKPESLLGSASDMAEYRSRHGQRAEQTDALVASVAELLINAQHRIPKREFGGLGLLVCSDASALPMCPLSSEETAPDIADVVGAICNASMLSNPHHDGFHILSSDLKLTHTNQYIAPPVPPDFLPVCRTPGFGARHMSALLASRLPAVICAAVLNTRNSILIFADGCLRAHFAL